MQAPDKNVLSFTHKDSIRLHCYTKISSYIDSLFGLSVRLTVLPLNYSKSFQDSQSNPVTVYAVIFILEPLM